jgi:ferredoxin--NADP+ reductase
VAGLYAAGWIKRGATGIIGTNKHDSAATVKALIADIPALRPCPEPDGRAVRELLVSRDVQVVSFADWERIDAAEKKRGELKGKPREKYVRTEQMLASLSARQ